MPRTKRTPTLAELVEAETGKSAPNPFVVLCVEQVNRMKAVIEAVPGPDRIDSHSACVAAFMILQAHPTYENLKALREALDAYEDVPFLN